MTIRKPYRISDGNGGHLWDWKGIKETVIGGVILALIISISTTLLNRYFNVTKLDYFYLEPVQNPIPPHIGTTRFIIGVGQTMVISPTTGGCQVIIE